MDAQILSLIVTGAGKIVSEMLRGYFDKPSTSQSGFSVTAEAPKSSTNTPSLKPTTSETINQLEGRLMRQLLRLQEDLLEGARINGVACDCILKHTLEMDVTAEELQTMTQKPIYQQIRDWARSHQWGPDVVAQHPPQFFVDLVPELRNLRKELGNQLTEVKPRAPIVTEVTGLAKQVKTGEISREQAMEKIKLLASGMR